ncbi:uncharacterized protein [Aegilops tauschii subsp. strangulata]|uniref:uncharacterized protein n=1 Tax=Aegilops tauschii subsp. strangulata TaxID=200361 RepID=UPI003CC8A6CA
MQQKLLLALLVTSRKLRHYFQGHPIKVISTYPLERVLRSTNAIGRVAEWNIRLHAFQLEFSTTRVNKGVPLADFVVEWTEPYEEGPRENKSLLPGDEAPSGRVMHFDDAFSRQGAGARVVLTLPTSDRLYYAIQLCFRHDEKVSNNIAEYEGLIAGLKAAAALGIKRLTIMGDSQLLVNFSNKNCKPKDEHKAAYLEEVRKLKKHFLGLELQHILRGINKEADDIAKRVSRGEPQIPGIFEEKLLRVSVAPPAVSTTLLRFLPCCPRVCQTAAQPREPTRCWHWSLKWTAGWRSSRLTCSMVPSLRRTRRRIWGLDILRPFPRVAGVYPYLYNAIDKFTKWAEVEPVHTIPAGSVVKFINALMSRFGVPNRIITDNGSQFTSGLFKSYCANLGTQIRYASVAHP